MPTVRIHAKDVNRPERNHIFGNKINGDILNRALGFLAITPALSLGLAVALH